jgi:hypothetical protein
LGKPEIHGERRPALPGDAWRVRAGAMAPSVRRWWLKA